MASKTAWNRAKEAQGEVLGETGVEKAGLQGNERHNIKEIARKAHQ